MSDTPLDDKPIDMDWTTVPDISASDNNSNQSEREREMDRAGESSKRWLEVILMFLAYFADILGDGPSNDMRDRTILMAEYIYSIGLGRMYAMGRGYSGEMTLAPEDRISMVADEAKRLDAALVTAMDQIASGDLHGDVSERIKLYEAPLKAMFWRGYADALNPSTGTVTWKMNPEKEHCEDCLHFAGISPMTTERFIRECVDKDLLPQSFNLECRGFRCGCWLESSKEDTDNG